MTVALGTNIANPISTALSQWLGFDTMGKLANYGKLGVADPDAVITALFASGEQGAWYDPSDLSTMFQDSTGTTPVTADGQPVGLIRDKSGRNNHASQATAAARPLYKTSGGLHWLQFDGVDDTLSTTAIDFTATDKMSIFAGVRRTGNGSIFETGVNRTSVGAFGIRAVTSELDIGFNINGLAYKTTTALTDAPQTEVIYAKLDAALTSYSGVGPMRVNAASAALDTGGGAGNSVAGYFGNHVARVGSYDGGGYLTGNVYSIIVRGVTSTTQEITDTETRVNGKTGAY